MGIRKSYFDGFHEFILQIGLYWIAIVGGAGISVLTFVLDGFGLPRLPRGAVYVVSFAAVFIAFFKVWQEVHHLAEQREAELVEATNSKPNPTISVQADKAGVRLMIRNDGAQGVFSAKVYMEADSKAHEGMCRWRGVQPESPLIASGGQGCIELGEFVQGGGPASRDNSPVETAWRIFYRNGQRAESKTFGRRQVRDTGIAWESVEVGRLRVELVSDPQMRQGREVRDFRLIGPVFEDLTSGTEHRVEPRHVSEIVPTAFVVW